MKQAFEPTMLTDGAGKPTDERVASGALDLAVRRRSHRDDRPREGGRDGLVTAASVSLAHEVPIDR